MLNKISQDYLFIIAILGVYLVFTYAIAGFCEKEIFDPVIYLHFSSLFLRGVFGFLLIAFLWGIILNFEKGIKSIFLSAQKIHAEYLKPNQVLKALLLIALMPVFFSCFTAFKNFTNYTKPFEFDPLFKNIDFYLHFKTHPWIILHQFLANENVIIILDWIYSKGWFVAWGPVFIWMALTSRRKISWVFFSTFMLSWLVMGTFLANLCPSAGPCYFEKTTGSFGPYGDLFQYLDSINNRYALDSVNYQKFLWQVYLGDDLIIGTGISAMPSMHISMMTTCMLGTLSLNRVVGVSYVFLTILFLMSSIYLGWHYAIDGYVSIVLTSLIWLICMKAAAYKFDVQNS